MLEQNRALKKERAKKQVELKRYGIVSVTTGDGLKQVFTDCGVDYCIRGGQTMNPSANVIAKAIETVKYATDLDLWEKQDIIKRLNKK